MESIFKATKAELAAARARRNIASRGTDEEYYRTIIEEWESLRPYGERANQGFQESGSREPIFDWADRMKKEATKG